MSKVQSAAMSLEDRVYGTIYGNCIGDAIGLLTEFLSKEEAFQCYGSKKLEYSMKVKDGHRVRWNVGDWTDDSDQMILIILALIEKKERKVTIETQQDFALRMRQWMHHGFPELGDWGGCGIGGTTLQVLTLDMFTTDPEQASRTVWERSGKVLAPNGGVMRTSILGVHQYQDLDMVIHNTEKLCRVTHADPRCIASCVAVTTAIAMMLQGKHRKEDGTTDAWGITHDSFEHAKKYLVTEDGTEDSTAVQELQFHMEAEKLSLLKLDERRKIGYTYKTLGAGFWALRQNDFRKAMTELVMEGGDADTNGAVAGALLGCKLGVKGLPKSWRDKLCYKKWLDEQIIAKYLETFPLVHVPPTTVSGDAPLPNMQARVCNDVEENAESGRRSKDGEGGKEKGDCEKETKEESSEDKSSKATKEPQGIQMETAV
ncbi:ADP-ribosyl-[dinitrogen reductase] glycohydrolase-like [Branchiostoma floridae x Branchiostoma belcheri]